MTKKEITKYLSQETGIAELEFKKMPLEELKEKYGDLLEKKEGAETDENETDVIEEKNDDKVIKAFTIFKTESGLWQPIILTIDKNGIVTKTEFGAQDGRMMTEKRIIKLIQENVK